MSVAGGGCCPGYLPGACFQRPGIDAGVAVWTAFPGQSKLHIHSLYKLWVVLGLAVIVRVCCVNRDLYRHAVRSFYAVQVYRRDFVDWRC